MFNVMRVAYRVGKVETNYFECDLRIERRICDEGTVVQEGRGKREKKDASGTGMINGKKEKLKQTAGVHLIFDLQCTI